jgi:hypothetical protein
MRNFILLALVTLAACSSKSNGASPKVTTGDAGLGQSTCGTWGATPGAPNVLGSDLPRAMGGFIASSCTKSTASGLTASSLDTTAIDGLGDTLYLPVLPLFDQSETSFVTPPKIIKVDPSGTVSDFYVFPASEAASYASGFYATETIDGASGNIARGVAVSTVVDAAGAVYYSDNLIGTVYKFDASGNRSNFATGVSGILSLAIGPDGAVYAATGAIYSGSTLATPPTIRRFDASGTPTTVATLPSTYNYSTGFFGKGGLPVGLMIDLAFDAAANIYVTVNMAGVVLKIAASTDGGTASQVEYAKGIDGISGVVASADGHLLVTAAPLFSGASSPTLTTNPQVTAIALDGTTSAFYQLPANDAYNTHYLTAQGSSNGSYYPLDAVFKLAADASGNVLLEDNLLNQVTLLPKN